MCVVLGALGMSIFTDRRIEGLHKVIDIYRVDNEDLLLIIKTLIEDATGKAIDSCE